MQIRFYFLLSFLLPFFSFIFVFVSFFSLKIQISIGQGWGRTARVGSAVGPARAPALAWLGFHGNHEESASYIWLFHGVHEGSAS